MLLCPKCRGGLEKVTAEKGVFWHCSCCDGRAATLPLLRRSVCPEFIRDLWLAARAGQASSQCHCPFCQQAMVEVPAVGVAEPFSLDVCTFCQLVWFDLHEFQALPQKPVPAVEAELPAAAREQLALMKVELIREQAEAGAYGESAAPSQWWQWLPGLLGMPVESEAGVISKRPWVTWGLSLLITVVSVAAFFDLEPAIARFGLIPAQYGRYGGLTLITSFFLHGGLFHLLSNLYFFLIFGDNVEDWLGKRSFLMLLLTAVLLGNVAHILGNPDPTIACIGASGGISGVMVFYALQFPHAKLGIMLRYFLFFRWIHVSAWVFVLIWCLLQMFGVWLQISGASRVSALAHLGGATAGFLFWWVGRDNEELEAMKPDRTRRQDA
ncbi:MAG: rhomboid family intramembrane serine protease [Lentisphaeria bacterium]